MYTVMRDVRYFEILKTNENSKCWCKSLEIIWKNRKSIKIYNNYNYIDKPQTIVK